MNRINTQAGVANVIQVKESDKQGLINLETQELADIAKMYGHEFQVL